MIADMLTLEENFPEGIKGKKLVFMGDAENNVANSLMVVCAKLGLHFVACGPEERMPNAELVSTCMDLARESGVSGRCAAAVGGSRGRHGHLVRAGDLRGAVCGDGGMVPPPVPAENRGITSIQKVSHGTAVGYFLRSMVCVPYACEAFSAIMPRITSSMRRAMRQKSSAV